jgi:hypothetical protein
VAVDNSVAEFESGVHHHAAVLPYAINPALVPHSPANTYFSFHIPTVRLVITKVFYSPTDEQVSCLKKNNIKIYIKKSLTCFGVVTPSSGSTLFMLDKFTVVKIVNQCVVNTVVMWLHIVVGPCWCMYVALFDRLY